MATRENVGESETTTLVQPPSPEAPPSSAANQTALATLRSDASRSRTTAGIGALLASFAAVFSLLIDGDLTGRIILMCGLGMVALTNAWVFFVIRDPARLRAWLVVVWTSSALGTLSLLPFCGVLSGGLIASMLTVSLASLGRSRGGSIAVCITVVVGHATLVLLVATGILPDRGRMPMPSLSSAELVLVEIGIAGVVVAAFAIGQWSRRNTMQAFAELVRRARAEGQREALGEVRDLARALGANRLGRYSDQRLGRFRVGAVLGRGAMGEVYEATPDDGSLRTTAAAERQSSDFANQALALPAARVAGSRASWRNLVKSCQGSFISCPPLRAAPIPLASRRRDQQRVHLLPRQASQRLEIDILMTCAESNHHHTTVFDRHGRYTVFMEHCHKMLARSQNAMRGRWVHFCAAEEPCVTRLLDRETVIARWSMRPRR